MSTTSSRSGPKTPSPSPILSELKDVTGGLDGSTTVSHAEQSQPPKPRPNPGSYVTSDFPCLKYISAQYVQGYRSQSFSTPSYNSYHKGHSRGFVRNIPGFNPHPMNDPNVSNDGSGRPNNCNSNRVASLTGSNLRSGPNNRGRRGGFTNRFPNRNPIQFNGPNIYPRYPGAQFMVPMPYPYYPGSFPMPMGPQPGASVLIPDQTCRCDACVAYFASYANPGHLHPPMAFAPQVMAQQTGGQVLSENVPRQFIPIGPYLQPAVHTASYIPDYNQFAAQQQALMYQQQISMASVGGSTNVPTRQTGPEPKNELTPIEVPSSVLSVPFGDGYYTPMHQPYYIVPPGEPNQPQPNFSGDATHNVQQTYVPGNVSVGGPGNTLPYALMPDRVIQNPSPQKQHKR